MTLLLLFFVEAYISIYIQQGSRRKWLSRRTGNKRGVTYFFILICGGIYFNMWGGVLFLYILAGEPCDSEGGSGCSDDGAEGCGQAEKGK